MVCGKKKSILKNFKFKTAEKKTTSDDEFSGNFGSFEFCQVLFNPL